MKKNRIISFFLVFTIVFSVSSFLPAAAEDEDPARYESDICRDGDFEESAVGIRTGGYDWAPYYDGSKVYMEIIDSESCPEGVKSGDRAARFINYYDNGAAQGQRGIFHNSKKGQAGAEPIPPNTKAGEVYRVSGWFKTDVDGTKWQGDVTLNDNRMSGSLVTTVLTDEWQFVEYFWTVPADGDTSNFRMNTNLITQRTSAEAGSVVSDGIGFVYVDDLKVQKVIFADADNIGIKATSFSSDGILFPEYNYWSRDNVPEGATTLKWQYADSADSAEWMTYKTETVTEATVSDFSLIPGASLANKYIRLAITPVTEDGKTGTEKYSEPYLIEKRNNILPNPRFANGIYAWSGDAEYSPDSCENDGTGSMKLTGTAEFDGTKYISFDGLPTVTLLVKLFAKGSGSLTVSGVREEDKTTYEMTDSFEEYSFRMQMGEDDNFRITLGGVDCFIDNITIEPQLPEVYEMSISGRYLTGCELKISYRCSWEGADYSIVKWYFSADADGEIDKTEIGEGKRIYLPLEAADKYVFAEVTPFNADGEKGVTLRSAITWCTKLYADNLKIESNGNKTNSILVPEYNYEGTLSEGNSRLEWLEADSLKTPIEMWTPIKQISAAKRGIPAEFVTESTVRNTGYLLLSQDQRNKYVRFKITPVNSNGEEGIPAYSEPTGQIIYEHNMVNNGDLSFGLLGWEDKSSGIKSVQLLHEGATDDATGSILIDASGQNSGKLSSTGGYVTNSGADTFRYFLSNYMDGNTSYNFSADVRLKAETPTDSVYSLLVISDKAGGGGVGHLVSSAFEGNSTAWTSIKGTETDGSEMGRNDIYATIRVIYRPDGGKAGNLMVDNLRVEANIPYVTDINITGNPKVDSTLGASYKFNKASELGKESKSEKRWEAADYPWGPWKSIQSETGTADEESTLKVTSSLEGKYLRFTVVPKDVLGGSGMEMWSSSEIYIDSGDNCSYQTSSDELIAGNPVNITATFENSQLLDRDITAVAAIYKTDSNGREKMTSYSYATRNIKAGEEKEIPFTIIPKENGGELRVYFTEGKKFGELLPINDISSSAGKATEDKEQTVTVDNDRAFVTINGATSVPESLYLVTVMDDDGKILYIGQGTSGEKNGGYSFGFSASDASVGSKYTVYVAQKNGVKSQNISFVYYGTEAADKISAAVKAADITKLSNYISGDLIDGEINIVEDLGIDLTYYNLVESKYEVLTQIAGKDYTGQTARIRMELERLSKERYEYEQWVKNINAAKDEIASASSDNLGEVLKQHNYLFELDLDNMYGFACELNSINRRAYNEKILAALKTKLSGTPEEIFDGIKSAFAYETALQTVNYGPWEKMGGILSNFEKKLGISLSGNYGKISDKTELYKDIYNNTFASIDEFKAYFPTAVEKYFIKGTSPGKSYASGGGGGSTAVPLSPNISETKQNFAVFSDIDASHWAYQAVELCQAKKIIKGYEDGSFRPENDITRAEFLSVLITTLGISTDGTECGFDDVNKNDWFYGIVAAAAKNGISNGYNNNEFRPNNKITREEMCVFTVRALKTLGLSINGENEASFGDMEEISDYAKESIELLSRAGIVNGTGDNQFTPRGKVTRAMAAKIAYELITKL